MLNAGEEGKVMEQPGNSQDSRVNPLMINDQVGSPERNILSDMPPSDSNILSSNDNESA